MEIYKESNEQSNSQSINISSMMVSQCRHAAFAIYPYSLFCYAELEQKAWFWLSRLFHLIWYLLRLNYCSLIKFSKLYRAGGGELIAFIVVHVRCVASASASLLAFYKIIFALVVQGEPGILEHLFYRWVNLCEENTLWGKDGKEGVWRHKMFTMWI